MKFVQNLHERKYSEIQTLA